MKPSYCKAGLNYLPVITHDNGKREQLFGSPLVNIGTAKKYAAMEILNRLKKGGAK